MFRGIAIFGLPGSGKTAIAKALAETINIKFYEASKCIIYPLANKIIPDTDDELIKLLLSRDSAESGNIPTISRTTARKIYSDLVSKHGENIIGRIIVDKMFQDASIITGLRGVSNAKYLYENQYLVIYLSASKEELVKRILTRHLQTEAEIAWSNQPALGGQGEILDDIDAEENMYDTSKISQYAHLSFDTTMYSIKYIADFIIQLFNTKECRICANINYNPVTPIGDNGLCIVCNNYQNNFDQDNLKKELEFVKSFITNKKSYDVIVGMSGGKDSTVTAYKLLEMGFRPLGFTLDIGYYPTHIMTRAADIAKILHIDHEIINIQNTITENNRESYRLTHELYNEPDSEQLSQRFRQLYIENRKHYSVKDTTVMPFVRSCQLCRKTVIPAYYNEAVKRGISLVVLGINEWTSLSQPCDGFTVSGIRRLQPTPTQPVVYIVHLPFLLRLPRPEMETILNKIGWTPPSGEELIEANTNSCLFAAATLEKARHMLGFNPDITRLSREVTVGFITKAEAKRALDKHYNNTLSLEKLII